MHHYGTRVLAGPNWKVAFDGYVDFYHLPILHKNTFGEGMSPDAVFHQFGPHQRITGSAAGWQRLAALPDDEWPIRELTGGVWSTFPHGSIAGFDLGGEKVYQVARIFPGPTPEESVSHLDYVSLGEPTEEFRRSVDKQIDFLVGVVRDEDYATGLKIQRTVRTGAKHEFVFGRNEGGAQHVHRWIDAVLATPDDELDELFFWRRAITPRPSLVPSQAGVEVLRDAVVVVAGGHDVGRRPDPLDHVRHRNPRACPGEHRDVVHVVAERDDGLSLHPEDLAHLRQRNGLVRAQRGPTSRNASPLCCTCRSAKGAITSPNHRGELGDPVVVVVVEHHHLHAGQRSGSTLSTSSTGRPRATPGGSRRPKPLSALTPTENWTAKPVPGSATRSRSTTASEHPDGRNTSRST